MEVSLQEATAAISLQSILAIKKEQEKSIAKALSLPVVRMAKKPLPARKDMITFNCKLSVCHTLAVYLQTKLKPQYLPQTYGGGILPWPQINLVGVATFN